MYSLYFKRALDILIAIIALPFVVIICTIVGLLIIIENPGNPLFIQERMGHKGRIFKIYKLRSMKLSNSMSARFAGYKDPRILKVGHVIRRTRIDELPQFFNVLKGEMSLIGPRPEQVPLAENFLKSIPNYERRLDVRPGITGLAQVEQGYVDSEEGTIIKCSFDLSYVESLSFVNDCKIILKTISVMLFGYGAR